MIKRLINYLKFIINSKMYRRVLVLKNTDKPNKNGRIYPKETMVAMIQKFGELSHEGEVFGCNIKDVENYNQTPLIHVSHSVKDLWMTDKGIMGTIKVLNTEKGNMLKMVSSNNVVFRPRGIGRVEDGKVVEFDLVSVDVIASVDDAFQN